MVVGGGGLDPDVGDAEGEEDGVGDLVVESPVAAGGGQQQEREAQGG